jgi:signal transduction histidine kinase
MDIAQLLADLKTASPDKQIEAIKALKANATTVQSTEIKNFLDAESSPWIKSALTDILSQSKVGALPSVESIQTSEEYLDIEAIKSEAVSDSIGQMLHELDPIIGSIIVAAQKETNNFPDSKLKIRLDRLVDVVVVFENWRIVERAPKYRQVNVFEVVHKEVNSEFASVPVGIIFNISKGLIFELDPTMFKIIVSNALRNAIESSNEISLGDKKTIVINAGITDTHFWLTIIDDGLGLRDAQEVLHKSRYSTKPGNKGFGLAIIEKAVKSLNGKWELKNSKVQGAEFYLEIPIKRI